MVVEIVDVDCLMVIRCMGESPRKIHRSGARRKLVKGKLQYVGTVFNGISTEDRAILADRMATLGRERPFVKTKFTTHWLKPKLMCRVNAAEGFGKKYTLQNPVFEARLADTE